MRWAFILKRKHLRTSWNLPPLTPCSLGAYEPQLSWPHTPFPPCISICSASWMPPLPGLSNLDFSPELKFNVVRSELIYTLPHTRLLFLQSSVTSIIFSQLLKFKPTFESDVPSIVWATCKSFLSRPQFFPPVKWESRTTRVPRTLSECKNF